MQRADDAGHADAEVLDEVEQQQRIAGGVQQVVAVESPRQLPRRREYQRVEQHRVKQPELAGQEKGQSSKSPPARWWTRASGVTIGEREDLATMVPL